MVITNTNNKNTPYGKYKAMLKDKQSNTAPKKLRTRLSTIFLKQMAEYVVSCNRNIRNKGYTNIQNLLGCLNIDEYRDNMIDISWIDFIKYGLDARLKYKLTDKDQVLDYICRCDPLSRQKINELQELSNDSATYIADNVTAMLDNVVFENDIIQFENISKEYYDPAATARDKQITVERWKNAIQDSHNRIRLNKIEDSDDEIICLRDETFDDYARDAHAKLSNPANQLSTGMVGYNYLLGGGFECGRTYCLFGLQGEGKSTTLLNLSLQMKRYNKKYKTKDPTKTPAVVYLTLENTKRETFSRLFSISVDTTQRMTDFDVDECIRMMRYDGHLQVTDDDPIDLIIKYKANNSIDTSYLYELYEDLADQGYEVIAFFIDYLNLIRSVNRFSVSEERLKLGSVVNELKAIASELDIPIITASQFNRNANERIDDARNSSSKNTVELLARSNIGESMLILNNIDGCYMLTPEYIGGGNKGKIIKFLGIKTAKTRYTPNYKAIGNNKGIIYQPYTDAEGIKLACDVGLAKPLYYTDMAEAEMDLTPVEIIDENVPIPDNSHRYQNGVSVEELKKNKKLKPKPQLNDNGEPVSIVLTPEEQEYYNEYMKNPPLTRTPYGDVTPDYSKLPEKLKAYFDQQTDRIQKEGFELLAKQPKDPHGRIIDMEGMNVYSDEYSLKYGIEPKEYRLTEHLSAHYNQNVYPFQFKECMDFLRKVRDHLIPGEQEDGLRLSPFCHMLQSNDSPFRKINKTE